MADAEYYREYYKKNAEKIREQRRRCSAKPHIRKKKLAYNRDWGSRNKKRLNAYLKSRRLANPQIYRAREKLKYAIRVGKIVRGSCEVCGTAKAEAHHTDYSKPYEVRWLCRTHHNLVHRSSS